MDGWEVVVDAVVGAEVAHHGIIDAIHTNWYPHGSITLGRHPPRSSQLHLQVHRHRTDSFSQSHTNNES